MDQECQLFNDYYNEISLFRLIRELLNPSRERAILYTTCLHIRLILILLSRHYLFSDHGFGDIITLYDKLTTTLMTSCMQSSSRAGAINLQNSSFSMLQEVYTLSKQSWSAHVSSWLHMERAR